VVNKGAQVLKVAHQGPRCGDDQAFAMRPASTLGIRGSSVTTPINPS
jgi:hypothetical protein